MKLRALDTRPPQTVRVTLDAATHEKLTVYLEYVRARGQHFADLKQLLAEIARAFVDGGDQEFLRWYRARTSPSALPTTTANGHRGARPPQGTQEVSSPTGGAKGALE